jgi:superfamily II DNA or RNA helicase/HKD family nuclease/SOS-response transcriptional repressor LexA
MNLSIVEALKASLETGFINNSVVSEALYQPELLVNTKNPPRKVLTSIIQELENCEEFFISVAFATTGGVAALINYFEILEKRQIPGKILVSQYLNFTQPEALRRLSRFGNIELRIAVNSSLHSKGYIFKSQGYYNLIVGSSNLTQSALATNKEWNLKVSAIGMSGIVETVLKEFNADFYEGQLVTDDFILAYDEIYKLNLRKNNSLIVNSEKTINIDISPNAMQIEALENLSLLRSQKKSKALLISATGTGKTYLAAFDAKSINTNRLLFVVHRLNIAKKALKSFKNIFEKTKSMGIYSGQQRELEKDFVFATVQTISKSEHYTKCKSDYFDYMIIDESHRSGAESYRRIIDYFEPKFLLGMTATPERTDGYDIFSLFDHNIAYEIRLHRAMEEKMLSPFHYYGVSEIIINNEKLENEADFKRLELEEKVDRIIEKIEFYGCDDGEVRGLIFCSTVAESHNLSEMFNERGFKTISLSGDSSEELRASAMGKLEAKNLDEKIDYIFTVDIFNEGIDIPSVNQVVMIRPTNSAIIFVQQLGRGLRKLENKQYLTVIDFIGNYQNNYLIPIALYGDTSYNKDSLRKLISEGSRMIPGASTINFDEISKQRIYESIDSANMTLLSDLKSDYKLLKYKLGRVPMMIDFVNSGARDPILYVEYRKTSYFNFVCRMEDNYHALMSAEQDELLKLFNLEINNAKRIEETILLKELLVNQIVTKSDFRKIISRKYKYEISDATIKSCINNLNFGFVNKLKPIVSDGESLTFTSEFKEHLKNEIFDKYLRDSIEYALFTYNRSFDIKNFRDGFLLYKKYTRKDVCRILNWPNNWESTVFGYKIFNNSAPLFVTYNKAEDISASTKYNDHFVSKNEFAWESKSNRNLESNEIKKFVNSNNTELRLLLFIQKSNDEGLDFYYMGDVNLIPESVKPGEKKKDNGGVTSVVHFNFRMKTPVQDSIYKYLVDAQSKTIDREEISDSPSLVGKDESKETAEIKQLTLFQNAVPLYDFYAAAGSFSDIQSEQTYKLIEVPEKYCNQGYFACKVRGESMNKVIPNGSICLFREYSGGSRNGKIMFVENLDIQDPDFNSAFTVKTYFSEKKVTEEGWSHQSIILKPNSYDNNYQNIIIDEDNADSLVTVGEFVTVL